MQKIIVLLLVLLAFGAAANAATVWNPAAHEPPILPPDVGNWNDVGNWTNGLPGDVEAKAVLNLGAAAAECQVTDAQSCENVVIGDGGPGGDVLRIIDGGDLTSTSWLSVGWNQNGQMIVEEGGVANIGGHLWMAAQPSPTNCVLDINGGTVNVGGNIGLGTVNANDSSGGTAFVNVNDGVLNLHHWNYPGSIQDGSVLDVRYGTVNITNDGDQSDEAQAFAEAGKITAFGGAGTLTIVHVGSVTTITATDPMDPWPKDITVPTGDVILSWTNLDPNDPADSVWVDVWFGTDPNKLDTLHYTQAVTIPADGENTTSVVVNAPDTDTYYWQVDSYIWGDPALVVYDNNDLNPNSFPVTEGDVWSFNATSDLPIEDVNAGLNLITWSNKLTPMDASVDDDGESPLTYAWSADPAYGVVFSATNVEDPDVTFAPIRAVVRGIQNNNDDAEEHLNADDANGDGPPPGTEAALDIGSDDLELGSEGNSGLDWQVIAVQYDTLGIPQGANITSAKITFQVDNSGEGAGRRNDFTILAELVDDAVPFADEPNNISERTRSAASVAWAPAPGPAVGTKIDTPDITALIKEVVDQAGWSEDNRLTLMIYPNVYLEGAASYTQVQEIEFEAGPGSDSATLTVMYEIPEGAPPAPGASTYTLTLAVNDEFNTTPIESTMTVDVYETPCYAAIAAGESANYIADFNGDCIINLADLAAMIAPYWADDYALTVPIPGP